MSTKLRDFIRLLHEDIPSRDSTEIGSFVTWIRRRVALLKHVDTPTLIEILRHSRHMSDSHSDRMLCQQSNLRHKGLGLRLFVVLRGSVSVYFNPFLSLGRFRRGSVSSLERVLMAASIGSGNSNKPLSAASGNSKRTGASRPSQAFVSVPEQPENDDDVGYDEPEKDEDNKDKPKGETPENAEQSHVIVIPTAKATDSPKTITAAKLGRFIVKYEKGQYLEEEHLLDEDGQYTATVIMDETSDLMVVDRDVLKSFKKTIEEETTTISNFVDNHPFFCTLPPNARGVLQISLRTDWVPAGSCIVKQGEPVNKVIFLISGSAEVVTEPAKHQHQYPELWPFETSDDVYFQECDWLRESRRRVYRRKYEHRGEVSRRRRAREMASEGHIQEVRLCSVHEREVIGVTEIVLGLGSFVNSLRCTRDCEIYTVGLKPFRRISKRYPNVLDMVRAYVHTKLECRLQSNNAGQIPLLRCLIVQLEEEMRAKSCQVTGSRNVEKLKERERDMFRLLQWFKLDKAPLVKHIDPETVYLREKMKRKAAQRERVRQRSPESAEEGRVPFSRPCLASIKDKREPMSLRQLREPVNEAIVKLRMEGTVISSEEELEQLLLRYSVTPGADAIDITSQTNKVIDEEYNLLRYRRHGNRLVRKFAKMIATGNPEFVSKARSRSLGTPVASELAESDVGETLPDDDETVQAERTFTSLRPTTFKSLASTNTYKTLQFERRSVTPNTLGMRIKDFHCKFGGTVAELENLPNMRTVREVKDNMEEPPLPGGKVFVTTLPCVSDSKHVHLKDHLHIRCQMLHQLPMNRVKGYRPVQRN